MRKSLASANFFLVRTSFFLYLYNMIEIPSSRLICSGAFTIIKGGFTNKTYVVPAWIEVPEGTQLSDIKVIYDKTYDNVVTPPTKRKEHIVKGSTGKMYTVIIDTKGNSCSCPGFGFHRTCKHIKHVLTNY